MVEKMNDTIAVRADATLMRQIIGVAERYGMSKSEWVRHVVIEAIAKEEDVYRHLHSVFGEDGSGGK